MGEYFSGLGYVCRSMNDACDLVVVVKARVAVLKTGRMKRDANIMVYALHAGKFGVIVIA